MKKWKILSLFLVLVLVVSNTLPTYVLAQDGASVEGKAVSQEAAETTTEGKSEKKSEEKSEEKTTEKEEPEEVHVTSVGISQSSLSLTVGESASLSAEVSPDNAEDRSVSWSSSDSGVASVNSDGKVSAEAAGTAKITVTSNDEGISATCTVTVSEKEETDQEEVSDSSEASSKDKDSDTSDDASSEKNDDQDSGDKDSTSAKSSKKSLLSSGAKAASSVKPKEDEDLAAYRTALADGTYTDFEFTWGGGTGKAKLTLTKITVKNGIARGVFTASSTSMSHVYYSGHTSSNDEDAAFYDPDSDTCGQDVLPIKDKAVTFPVVLNKKTDVACRTTAMSAPHWVQYEYTITITEPDNCKVKFAGENEDGDSVSVSPTVTGPDGKTVKADDGYYELDRNSTYTVSAKADGYKEWNGTLSPSQDGETITLIMEAKSYDVKIKATDEKSGKAIDNVSITVTDEKTGSDVEGSDGSYDLSSLHTYTITVAGGDDYEDAKKENVSVSEDTTIEIPLKAIDPEDAEKYALTVVARNTDDVVLNNAVVDVSLETDDQTIHVKPVDGKYSLLARKNYTVTVSAVGYESLSKVIQLSEDSTETFRLEKTSYPIHVRVIEESTEYNLSKATLTVKDSSGKIYTGSNNTFSVPYNTSLTVTASYTGYETSDGAEQASQTITVTGEDTVTLALVKKTFSVKTTAIDALTGKTISGAKFTVTDSNTGKTVSAADGAYPLTYTSIYTIAASASGYADASVTHKCTSATTVSVKLTPVSSDSDSSSSGGSSSTTEKTEKVVNNGTYNIKFKDAENSMFNVVGAVLHVKNGKYTADISLSGTGYDYVYPSTAAAAKKAGKSKWSKYWKNSKGLYTYTIEVPYLDKPFILASRSIKYASDPDMKDQAWRDGLESGGSHGSHEIILYSKYTNGKNLPTHNGTRKASSITPATDDTSKKTSKKSSKKTSKKNDTNSTKYNSNTGGGTSSVNNSTGLKDGTYKPDSFSFSGGTGKVRITCDQIIVKGGKTYARITFSSTYFQYVKAGGKKITDYTRTASSTSFVIPCQLNQNNKILGMTTKMSQPHEIAYTLYIGLNAAKTAGTGTGTTADGTSAEGTAAGTAATSGKVDDQYEKLDAQAPEIIGLTYKGEVPVTYSDKIKIFEYQDGFMLVELDVRKDTALDSEITGIEVSTADESQASASTEAASAGTDAAEAQTETQAAATTAAGSPATAAAAGGEEEAAPMEKTASEQKAALYDNAIYKYLIVPEKKDVPAGIEKQLFVVQMPADKTVVTSPEALETLDKLKLHDQVMGIGIPKKEIPVKSFKDAMKKKNGKKAKILDVGTYDKLDYRQLLLNEANVLFESPEIIPHLGKLKGFPQKTKEDFAKMTDAEKKDFEALAKKQALKLKTIGMRGVQLGMGVIVDRSSDEKNNLAKAEWLKLYGILYGKQAETDAMYKKVVDNASEAEKKKAAVAAPAEPAQNSTETESTTGTGTETAATSNTETGEEVQ